MPEIEKKEIDSAAKDFAKEDNYKYIAFISYRHLEPDASIAKKIHTMIETFKLPKEFYVDGKKPNFRVFRDREELTTSSLSASIDDALRNSKYLIIICSKRLPKSEWCNIEAETFIRLHGIDRVIPVLLEGEPEESFPKALLGGKEEIELEDGTVQVHNKDILAAEFRSAEVLAPNFVGFEELEKTNPSKLKSLTEESLKLMKDEKYRIMAAILGVSYGDLRQRDKERRQRRLLTLSGIIGAALLFFGIFMVNAYRNENMAKRQTIQDKATFMLDKSEELLKTGDMYKSILVSNSAMKDIDKDMADYKNLTSRHRQVLNDAVNQIDPIFYKTIVTNNQFTFFDLNKDGTKLVAGLNNDSIGVWDVKTGNLLNSVAGHKQQVKLTDFSEDDSLIASGGFDGLIIIRDGKTLEQKVTKQVDGNIMLLEFGKDNSFIDTLEARNGQFYFNRYDTKTLNEIGNQILLGSRLLKVVFDKEHKFMWALNDTLVYEQNKSLIKYDLASGKTLKTYEEDKSMVEDFLAEAGPDGKKPLKEQLNRYTGAKLSRDEAHVFLRNDLKIKKLRISDDKVVAEYPIDRLSQAEDMVILESKDGKYVYTPKNYSLMKLDAKTGEKILEISPGVDGIKRATFGSQSNIFAVLGDKGDIVTIEDDKIKETVTRFDSGANEYISLTPKGDQLISLTLTETKIKLLELNQKRQTAKQNGQIVAVSDNQKYIVVYNKGKYQVWDTVEEKLIREFSHEKLNKEKLYLLDNSKLIISNDGNFVGGVEDFIVGEGKAIDARIYIIDTRNSKLVFADEKARYTAKRGFSPDSKYVYFTVGINEIYIYNIIDNKLVKKITTKNDFFNDAKIDSSSKYIYASFAEGISEVYRISDGKFMGDVVGTILNIDILDDEKISLDVIYNNQASRYENFKKAGKDIILTPRRSEHGVSLEEALVYNPEKDLLLSIKSKGEQNYFYLIDFKTGGLIQAFENVKGPYSPMAYITPDAKKIGFDFSYQSTNVGEESKLDYSSGYVIYPILDYNQLKQIANKTVENVNLTDQEKESLKIE